MSTEPRKAVDNGRRSVMDIRVARLFDVKPNGWFAGAAAPSSESGASFRLSGTWPGIAVGQIIKGARLRGQTHAVHGDQWVLESAGADPSEFDSQGSMSGSSTGAKLRSAPVNVDGLPCDAEALKSYLADRFKGVGPARAGALVEHFGPEGLMQRLDAGDAVSLAGVAGVVEHTARLMTLDWTDQASTHRALIALRSLGLHRRAAEQALKRAMNPRGRGGTDNPITAVRRICHYPYRLTLIDGVGFATADSAAQKLGVQVNAPSRVIAATRDQLQKAASEGHTMVPIGRLAEGVSTLLARDSKGNAITAGEAMTMIADIDTAQEGVVFPEGIVEAASPVCLMGLAKAEAEIALRLGVLMRAPPRTRLELPSPEVVAKVCGFAPDKSQLAAVVTAFSEKVAIITGGPGCGKTSITRAVARLMVEQGQRVLLVAPTGRAARRLARVTGLPAVTMHRLLGASWGGQFKHDAENLLSCDVVMLDEGSMSGAVMFNRLVQAMPPHARLIKIGDPDQLPSVEAGAVLADLIGSRALPVAQLLVTHRTELDNPINDFAHNIRSGIPKLPPLHPKHLAMTRIGDPDDVLTHLVARTLSLLAEGEPQEEIVVLTPGHNGSTGTVAINRMMQRRLNHQNLEGPRLPINESPRKREGRRQEGEQVYLHVGDMVMHTTNSVEQDLSNGDPGRVLDIDPSRKIAFINFDGETKKLEGSDVWNVVLSYGKTIHASQGQEARNVLLPVTNTHARMLRRNLLYTGATRAKHYLEMAGNYDLVVRAINNTEDMQRHTLLQGFVRRDLRQPDERPVESDEEMLMQF